MRQATLRSALAALLSTTAAGCMGAVDALGARDADTADAADAGEVPTGDAAHDVATHDRVDAGAPEDGPDVPDAPPAPPPPEPDFERIQWASPGHGVFFRDSENPRGQDVFIGYAGYPVQAPWAQAWVTRLYLDALRARGVRYVYAVQGPRDAGYAALEIGNSRLIAHFLPRLAPGARILVAAHSSGAFVAHELLGQLYTRGLDPTRRTAGRLSYWDLDGGGAGLNASLVGQLHHAWFVWATANGVESPNAGTMRALGRAYPAAGGALRIDADASGCRALWCVHMALINDRPHNATAASLMADYASFDGAHPVASAWLSRTNFGAL